MICTEALFSLLYQAEKNQLMSGLRLIRVAPVITHILFADDSLIFSRATLQDYTAIMNILQLHEVASRQMVNFNKSS